MNALNEKDNAIIEEKRLFDDFLYLPDYFDYETTEDCNGIIVNGVIYPYELTLDPAIPDYLACRVKINGLYYHFG